MKPSPLQCSKVGCGAAKWQKGSEKLPTLVCLFTFRHLHTTICVTAIRQESILLLNSFSDVWGCGRPWTKNAQKYHLHLNIYEVFGKFPQLWGIILLDLVLFYLFKFLVRSYIFWELIIGSIHMCISVIKFTSKNSKCIIGSSFSYFIFYFELVKNMFQ